jgi:putative SOS response-associated peptidase YedK
MNVARPRLAANFPSVDFPLTITPRYNIAPTQDVLTLRQVAGRAQAELVRWGIGLASADRRSQRSVINVRSETAVGTGLFRQLLDRDRALLIASHFYEWQGRAAARRPMLIGARLGLMAFAGLIGRWRDPTSHKIVPAVTILTCPPNPLIAPLHHRMPVILDPAAWQPWLDPDAGVGDVAGLLVPCPESWLEMRPVSRLVNDPRNDGPELLSAEAEPTQVATELQLPLLDEP